MTSSLSLHSYVDLNMLNINTLADVGVLSVQYTHIHTLAHTHTYVIYVSLCVYVCARVCIYIYEHICVGPI